LSQWQQGQVKTGEVSLSLPPAVERALLDFLTQELAAGKAELRATLVEAQQALAELATEAEGQAQEIGDLSAALEAERQNAASLRGELVRLQEERDQVRMETRQERKIAEGLRIELAKASLQLESLPALQAELSSERAARIAAEKQVAVLEERMQWAPSPSRG
jgi:predicted nuclease with TOPRIM domain